MKQDRKEKAPGPAKVRAAAAVEMKRLAAGAKTVDAPRGEVKVVAKHRGGAADRISERLGRKKLNDAALGESEKHNSGEPRSRLPCLRVWDG